MTNIIKQENIRAKLEIKIEQLIIIHFIQVACQ